MGEIALVTGAAGALGSEVARTLFRRGHRLALFDDVGRAAALEALAASLGGAFWSAGDAADEANWSRELGRLERSLDGRPSSAALLAGAWRGGKPMHEETGDETWRAMMKANVETAYRALRALLPSMVGAGRGSIVVVGSRVVEQPATSAGAAAYAASKAALVALARTVAAEVLEHGVRINALLPSAIDTPANRAAMPHADPLRWVSPSSAAEAIAFLLSDAARDISGVALPIYGRA